VFEKQRPLKNGYSSSIKKMLAYRKYIVYEAIISIVFVVAAMIPILYSIRTVVFRKELFRFYVLLPLGILLMLYMYKKMYFNNIKKIQESLAEIEEFHV
jgi:hypothetical protein